MLYLHVFQTHSVDVDYKYNGAQTEMSTPETNPSYIQSMGFATLGP